MPTKQQADVLIILQNMRMKQIVMWCIIVAFFIILILFVLLFIGVFQSGWPEKTIIGVLEGFLARTMYPMVDHFFPAQTAAKKAEKRADKKN